MAYQQTGGMLNNAANAAQANDHHGPQGAEYTLQGVMRFLQIEWHNHERARNAWDIERAEMKAKIAKHEGECRHAKRINEQLERQVRMLESALKQERRKKGSDPNAPLQPDNAASHSARRQSISSPVAQGRPADLSCLASHDVHNSFLDTTPDKQQYRDKSKKFLDRCLQEVQYLLTPPPHPPPPQLSLQNPSAAYTGLPDPPVSLDELYLRRAGRSYPPSTHVQLQPPVNLSAEDQKRHLALSMPPAQPPTHTLPRPPQSQSVPLDEPVEQVTHSYDSYGRPVASTSDAAPRSIVTQDSSADGWNFDDQQPLPEQPPADLPQPPRRPDTDLFPSAANPPSRSPPRTGSGRRRSSGSQGMARRRSSGSHDLHDSGSELSAKTDPSQFKVKFALRGHLDVVRSVIFTGGGSPSEPEICTAGDDGTIKRWIIPASYSNFQNPANNDLDIACYFTHRGHEGVVTSLAACPSTSFSTGGRVSGDGWIFSGGQDATVRVWERGRVDPKATLEGHTDAVWTVCLLPGTVASVFGSQSSNYGGPDRILLATGSADGTVKIWSVSAPPQLVSPQAGSRRGGSRRHSVTSGSNHPSSPQPNVATSTPFHYTLVHSIQRESASGAAPTCISPLSPSGENFVVSYTDSSVLIFDTRTGEEIIGMASNETYDGTLATSINAVVATSSASLGLEAGSSYMDRADQEESVGAGPTGSAQGVEGVIVSGHEDRYIRFFDANSGQCTYTMLAHPSAISSLSLSKDGREAVSAGHDASIRFWSLEKRQCTQDITSHRPMRGEGVCSVVWSQDGRYVVSAGGDGVVKVFAR
ncbi:WD40 repeat-like protein, partial [Aureobasidium melanogenum]